jgi:hypothetical protein
MKEYQTEVAHVHLYSMDHSSFFMLAVGAAGAGVISNRLASDASVPHYWSNNEWTFCISLCVDYAACENFAWTSSKVKNKKILI